MSGFIPEEKITEIKNTGIKYEVIPYSVENGSGLPQIQKALRPRMTYFADHFGHGCGHGFRFYPWHDPTTNY